jgi:hypothetical protein
MNEKIERLPTLTEGALVAAAAQELEAIEGGYVNPPPEDWCGTCRNPMNPSGNPMGPQPGWPGSPPKDPFAPRTIL